MESAKIKIAAVYNFPPLPPPKKEKFAQETWGAYYLARKSGNFGLKSNGKVIFRKFCSEIVEYLQRYSSFSVRNGTEEISLPFAKLSSFQSLIDHLPKTFTGNRTVFRSVGFADLEKPLPLI